MQAMQKLASQPMRRAFRGVRGKASLEGFGNHLFKGAVADRYLGKQGLPSGTIEAGEWVRDAGAADKVAQAVTDWATDHGATVFCHWFQPLGSSGVRHGNTGQVQLSFFHFNEKGQAVWDLKGKDLLKGESDGSSYPNGGLRDTHEAGAYLAIDPTSPIFLRGDTIYIPAAFATFHGHSIDEKIPLLRASNALNREGKRLMKNFGYDVPGVEARIGLEQEFFLVPRDAFHRRPDLMMTGRTVMGRDAPRGQEMCDHYYGAVSEAHPALACLQDLQKRCYDLGIPLKTRHREVAPGQYEIAPLFGTVTTQSDQNLVTMQILEEVAAMHGLAALTQEKPFNNVNGSGKHNNWSLWTTDSEANFFDPEQLTKKSGSPDAFPAVMAGILSAVDKHGDLMRMAIASPGNDFRLGACEAPPCIISTYLGDSMTKYLEAYKSGKDAAYKPHNKEFDLGIDCMPPFVVPAEDRNRTSPFPYGGKRFEFRAVGSSQNCSLVNTVLACMTAEAFSEISDAIESGKKPREVTSALLDKHWKAIFNGNNYDVGEQERLTKEGVWRIDSAVDAICRYTDPKNIKLFESLNVLTAAECAARQTINLDHYVGSVEMEVLCMIDMINQHVIPSVKRAGVGPQVSTLEVCTKTLKAALQEVHDSTDEKAKGALARILRLETMEKVREVCDAAESVVPAGDWTLATYSELLFLDKTE